GHHVVDVRVDPVIRVVHRLLPGFFLFRWQAAGLTLVLVDRREMADQVAEGVDDAARIFVAEAAEEAVSAARINGEDGLQMRRLLFGYSKLLGAEAGNAD